MKHWKDLRHLG